MSFFSALPLGANVKYNDTVVTSDSYNSGHIEHYEKVFMQELKISYEMVYKTL